jgi:hypothetical protein
MTRAMHPTAILLATANARYTHPAFGLRWLWANLGPLRACAAIREYTLSQSPLDIAEDLLRLSPRIIGFSVHIWNVMLLTEVVQIIKTVSPDTVLILGGPEVSYEYEDTAIFAAADYLIRGEGEVAIAALANDLLEGRRQPEKVIAAEPPDLDRLVLPYDAYTDEDLARRLTYVEASRGCPFGCEFCLSSLDARVREFPLEPFLDALARLIERGARRIKFVDRTFNLRAERVEAILDFLKRNWRDGMIVHFEILPDRLSARMLELIAAFPPGHLHLEVGVQSLNPASLEAIGRRQDIDKTLANVRFLREETGALIHADLVLGLPFETWDTIGHAFNELVALHPHELQVGILKRLKGAPICRHPIRFATHPPYEVLQTEHLSFEELQRLKRFARYFDLYYNSGNFPETLPMLWRVRTSAFDAFMALSDSIWAETGRTHEFPLTDLIYRLYDFLVEACVDEPARIATALDNDYHRLPGRKERLEFPK